MVFRVFAINDSLLDEIFFAVILNVFTSAWQNRCRKIEFFICGMRAYWVTLHCQYNFSLLSLVKNIGCTIASSHYYFFHKPPSIKVTTYRGQCQTIRKLSKKNEIVPARPPNVVFFLRSIFKRVMALARRLLCHKFF